MVLLSRSRVLCDGSDPVDDSWVLLFRFNSFGEPNPKKMHKLRDSGGGAAPEIRQKCFQNKNSPLLYQRISPLVKTLPTPKSKQVVKTFSQLPE